MKLRVVGGFGGLYGVLACACYGVMLVVGLALPSPPAARVACTAANVGTSTCYDGQQRMECAVTWRPRAMGVQPVPLYIWRPVGHGPCTDEDETVPPPPPPPAGHW